MRCYQIALISCGGTIVSQRLSENGLTAKTATSSLASSFRDSIIQPFPDRVGSSSLAITPFDFSTSDSTVHGGLFWFQLNAYIDSLADQFDGFVITHGTNTLAYTAAALCFSKAARTHPVLITGAQKPLSDPDTDGPQNVTNALYAVQTALQTNITGVTVCFGKRLMKADRATKSSPHDFDGFRCVNGPDLGFIGINGAEFTVKPQHEGLTSDSYRFSSPPTFNASVGVIVAVPDMAPDTITNMMDSRTRAIILLGYGDGDLPLSLLPAIQSAQRQKFPILIHTQCHSGIVQMALNHISQPYRNLGVIPAGAVSLEYTIVLARAILGDMGKIEDLRRIFKTFTE